MKNESGVDLLENPAINQSMTLFPIPNTSYYVPRYLDKSSTNGNLDLLKASRIFLDAAHDYEKSSAAVILLSALSLTDEDNFAKTGTDDFIINKIQGYFPSTSQNNDKKTTVTFLRDISCEFMTKQGTGKYQKSIDTLTVIAKEKLNQSALNL